MLVEAIATGNYIIKKSFMVSTSILRKDNLSLLRDLIIHKKYSYFSGYWQLLRIYRHPYGSLASRGDIGNP